MKDIHTWNELAAEVARLERENQRLKDELRQVDRNAAAVQKELMARIPDWIPICERLPGKDERVLTYTPNSDGRNYQVVGGWICHHTWIDITHWMPLPEAPIITQKHTTE